MDKIELPLLKGNKDNEKIIPLTVIVGLIILIISFFVALASISFKSTYKLHYKDKSNLDYKVYLKENDVFKEKYLDKDKEYISSIVDYIDADFDYTFTSEKDLDLEYIYYISAKVLIDSLEGKNVYESNDILLDKKKLSANSSNHFNINENIKIDYDKYNSEAKRVLNNYNLSVNANLVVSLNVEVIGKYAEFDKNVNNKEAVTLNIPLTNKTTGITMSYNLSNNKDSVLQYRSAVVTKPMLLYSCIFFAVIDVCFIVLVVSWIIRNRDYRVIYKKKLNKILRDYSRYISETVITERVEDLLKTKSLKIVMIRNFEDLLDIRDSINKPILFHEEVKDKEAIFYIISEGVGYVYLMKSVDFKKYKKH